MPKIPTFEPQQGIPTTSGQVPVSPEQMAAPYEALTRAGAQIEQTGLHAAKVFSYLQDQERQAEVQAQSIKMKRQLRDATETIAESYNGATDWENFETRLQGQINDLQAQYRPGPHFIKGDRWDQHLQMAFDEYLGEQASALKKVIHVRKLQAMGDETVRNFQADYDQALKDYADAPDDGSRQAIKARITDSAWDLVNSRFLTREQAHSYVETFGAKGDEAHARETGLTNAAQAVEWLKDKSKYPNLDPVRRQELIDHFSRLQKQQEQDAENKALTAVYTGIKTKYGNDFDQIFSSLQRPEEWDALGISTIEQKQKLEHIFQNERITQEAMQKDRHDKNFIEVYSQKGAISPVQVDQMVREDEISPAQGDYLKNPKAVKTDFNYWAQMFDAIKAGKDVRKDILYGAQENVGLLAEHDAKQLYSLQTTADKPEKAHYLNDPWFRLSDQRFREVLGQAEAPSDPAEAIKQRLQGTMGPRQGGARKKDDRYYNAITDLMRAVEQSYTDKKPLQGEAIWKQAQGILAAYASQKPPQEGLDKLPPAQNYRGIVFTNPQTGERRKSDGKQWLPIRPAQ